ncbi:MAG: heterodisulfide reductase [candidate division Zixibacteria bacterium]|nr:heterodisulfide reductase [candidate division Zixibacteria bacterium]
MAERERIIPDSDFIRSVRKAGGDTLKKCYQCATCSVVCKLSENDSPFPRKEMVWAQWGLKDKLVADPNVWACHQCNDCTIHCPRGARPGDVLAGIRSYTFENFSFPKFMGKALASPAALPVLFLVPIAILIVLIMTTAPTTTNGEFLFLQSGQPIDFNIFLPHTSVDVFFVIGNIFIFMFAAIGFSRFWKKLKSSNTTDNISFIKSLTLTIKEILTHSKFNKCETNKPRAVAHYMVLGGFLADMAATGLAFVIIFIPHYINLHPFWWPPLDLPNPIKILGALGGVLILLGSGIMLYRRWTNRDEVGANGYQDYLFLYVLFFTGLSGMLAWLTRWLLGVPMTAYIIYFIHIVFVYFLLWYMPYSKFAHMFYRTMALIYINGGGRRK